MSMDAGDETVGAGTMAKAIYDALASVFGAAPDADQDDNRKKAAAAIAQGVVSHIAANAEVDVTIGTGDSGLQTTTTDGNPTDGPAADKSVSGTVS